MDAPFYHDTFRPPPTGDSVPPPSCLSANRMSADALLPFLYPGHAPSGHTPSNHSHRPSPRTTQEQEGFADGFVRALASLHQQGGVVTGVFSANSASSLNSASGGSGDSSLSSTSGVICASIGSGASSLSSASGGISVSSASGANSIIGASGVIGASIGNGASSLSSASGVSSASNLSSASCASSLSGSVEPLVYTNLAVTCHAHQHHRVSMTTAYQAVPDGITMTTAYQAVPDVSERKKLRNRIAASRCRRRKLERIARLEERVRVLRSLNGRLVHKAIRLRGQVGALRSCAATHLTGGCQIAMVTDGEGAVFKHMMDEDEEEVMGGHAHMDHDPHVSVAS